MRFEIRQARRFLLSKNGGFRSVSTAAALVGISVSIACLIVVEAVYTGFLNEVQQKILSTAPHITVREKNQPVTSRLTRDKLRRVKGVKSVSSFRTIDAVAQSGSVTSYARVRVEQETENGATVIGAGLAEALDVDKGDSLNLLFLDKNEEAVESLVEIEGILKTGFYEKDRYFLSVRFEKIEGLPPGDSLDVRLADPLSAPDTALEISNMLGSGFEVTDWRMLNTPLFSALEFERRIAYFVFGFILLLAAVTVATNYLLLVRQRKIDLALLRVAGASRRFILRMFVFESGLIALAGVAGGVVIGLTVCLVVNTSGLFELPPEIYAVSEIELAPGAGKVILIGVFGFLVSQIAILVPLLHSTSTKPWEILRRR